MKPVNKKKNVIPISYECITWEGENIPCLDIYKNDELSAVTYTITEEVCKLAEGNDLSSLTVEKLYSLCNGKKIEKELVPILQLMIDNNICFKDTIDNILIRIGLLESGKPFTLNTSCLGKNINTVTKTLQEIIINICSLRTDVDNINTILDGIELQLDNLSYDDELENIIDTCLAQDETVSQQTIIAALEACSLNVDIGEFDFVSMNDLDAYYTIGSPTIDGCTQTYDNGWIVKVDCDYTIADVTNNLAIALFSHDDRIQTIEEDCCTSKCEDILLGFSVITNEEQTAIILRWRDVDGTKIPSDFTDCGSRIIVTDVNGEKETFDIEIENELITDDLDISNLDLTEPVEIQVLTKFCSDSYTCTQCLGITYDMQVDGCPVCLITSEGTGLITIIYEDE